MPPIIRKNAEREVARAEILANSGVCGYHAFFHETTSIRWVMTGNSDCVVVISQIETVMISTRIEIGLD